MPGGIFTSAYYIYNVVTEPLGWEVMRRYNDFAWLRDVLTKLYPGKNVNYASNSIDPTYAK